MDAETPMKPAFCALCLMVACSAANAQEQSSEQHHHHDMAQSEAQDPAASGMNQTTQQMDSRNLSDSAHMKMTSMRSVHPGDQQKADEILAGARKAMEQYRDYRVALGEGYQIFLPNLPQKMYHFTNYRYAWEEAFTFNPAHPTSLLYEKLPSSGYKLIGVMYTAPKRSSLEQLDERVPLSIAEWHAHVNF